MLVPWNFPTKTNIKPENDGSQKDVCFFQGFIFKFQPLVFGGVTTGALLGKIFSSWPSFSSQLHSFRGLTSTRPTWLDQMKDLKVPVLVLAEGASAGGMGMKRFFKPFDMGVCVGTFDKSTIRWLSQHFHIIFKPKLKPL